MTDRNVEFPNRFRLVKVPGTDSIYDIEPVPGEVFAEGTFLNKNNLLSDNTAASLGLSGDPTVDDAFGAIFSTLDRKNPAYASDFLLYIMGQHPALSNPIYNDYDKVRFEMMMFAYKDDFERTISQDFQLTGNYQNITVRTTVYDGGNV